jgi:hypothetical protein
MGVNDLANNLNMTIAGQSSFSSNATQSSKILYLAIVKDISDFSNMGRIRAEIIDFDKDTGENVPGKDKNDVEYKFAFPLIPDFLNIMPRPGELVYIFLENPSDQSSKRFYIGPIRSVSLPESQFESTSSANNLFSTESYFGNSNFILPSSDSFIVNKDDIYIKSKNDSDVILKSREVLIRAGSLQPNVFVENTQTPCYIQLVQKREGDINAFSQTNIVGSNINLISSDSRVRRIRALDENGNLVDSSNVEISTNPRLNEYGNLAKELHPLVLGDELIKVLKVLIRFCLNHKHTPQETPYAPTEEIGILNDFLADENIEFILSKSVRTS